MPFEYDYSSQDWLDSRVALLSAWRPLALKAGNTVLLELAARACLMRDGFELEATRQLFIDLFEYEELVELARASHERLIQTSTERTTE